MTATKAKRGTVTVEGFRGMLRLRWSFKGKRYGFSMGVPDSAVNRIVAEGKAKVIEGDMVTGNFDDSLAKYRPVSNTVSDVTVIELFQKFQAHKTKKLYSQSLAKYKALHKPLTAFFKNRAAVKVDVSLAEKFCDFIALGMEPVTVRERLTTINACWEWGIKTKLLTVNPWGEVLRSVKVPPKQRPNPFTKPESEAILNGFRTSTAYGHYADFVEFLLSTGCRTGEAIALQWKHLTDDCSVVWIGESIARGGERKPTKTNRSRRFKLSPRVKALLKRRYSGQSPDSLVFPSPRGGHIDDHNFRSRAWVSILTSANVKYRHPYNCRHTFISHSLYMGMAPVKLAEITGHDVKVLLERYAADVSGGLEAVDWL
jgi:integrase